MADAASIPTCTLTAPHNHSSLDDPIDCAWRDRAPTPRRAEKRVRDAYICFWANKTARDKLDALAKERGVTRSEMARTVFGCGLAALGGIK